MKISDEKQHPSSYKKILVVDDEEIIRKSCKFALSRGNYSVETIENGVKALQLLSKNDFDIVIVDLMMPLMDGIELLKTINHDFPYLQVIIMTGFATIENAINAMKEGAYDFILKPFKADQLRVTVDRCANSIDLNSEIRELKVANQKLRELQEMKDKFIAITSHELRTPVSHIKGYLSILNDPSYSGISDIEKNEYMKIIDSAISDLEYIVQKMFDILKFENNRFQLHFEKTDVNQLIMQVISEFQFILKNRKLNVNLSEIQDEILVECDRYKIKQVISELMQNAIKFTPDGGNIQIITSHDKNFFTMKFVDTGVGIKESEKNKIFEKFYEAQNTDYHSSSKTNFMGGGLGLGLNIVKAIVEAHEGRISFNSKYDNGTEFTVRLPLVRDE